MSRSRATASIIVAATLTMMSLVPADARSRSGRVAAGDPPPVVIAVVEDGGMNVLHSDFALAPGQSLELPEGARRARELTLPRRGTFEERMDAVRKGPLGNMKAGTLYGIHGTRIVGLFSADDAGHDITADRFHATGTTAAAVGLKHGTNPDALLVFVADGSRKAWEWLEKQTWIDLVSTSYYGFSVGSDPRGTCMAGPSIRRISEQGRVVFSAIGNGEQAGAFFPPSGYPDSYQVGGVDDQGKTYRPDGGALGPTRPYETGDRFSFPSANADALTGSMDFGGTSGATPSTAGRAAALIAFARRLLGSDVGLSNEKLATLGSGGRRPPKGPLADGDLTRDELIDLMHHTATPAEPPSPIRYLVEGYGAFQERAVALAKRVLAGAATVPERPQEDVMHDIVDPLRGTFFPSPRC